MKFKTSTILAITSDLICADFEDIFDLLSYMIGRPIFGHQLFRAVGPCATHLLASYPELAEKPNNSGDLTSAEVDEYIRKMEEKLGSELEITPLQQGKYEYKDPIKELCEIVDAKRVIVYNSEYCNALISLLNEMREIKKR